MAEPCSCQAPLGHWALSPCSHLSSHEGEKSFVESCLKQKDGWVAPCLSPAELSDWLIAHIGW